MFRRIVIHLGVLCALLGTALTLAGSNLSAQTFVSLSGTVADPSGAMLPGATLVLTNTEAGAKYEIQSTRTGSFEFVGLPPGAYTLDVNLPGFQSLTERIAIAGRAVSRTLTLQLGELEETLHVAATRGNPGPALPPRAPDTQAIEGARLRFQRVMERCSVQPAAGGTRVGGNIRPPVKIRNVNPQYPAGLAEAGQSGTVRLQAVIGPDGYVRDIRNVDQATHPDLVNASMDAVREWQFDGTLLNCVPVEVTMHVLLQFEAR